MNKLANVLTENVSNFFDISYKQLDLDYHVESQALWFYMNAQPRPCYTPKLLAEIQDLFQHINSFQKKNHPVRYLVAASGIKDVYSLGGDLDVLSQFIKNGERDNLRNYAYKCLDMSFECATHFNRDITTISLIQGNALGSGFETALSCNVIVAEESAQVGFPEILFNLFPGFGAYTYLSRRVHPGVAEKMICSGRMYTGAELYDLGVVDVLAEDGEGVIAVQDYIKQHSKQRIGRVAMQKAYLEVNPVSLAQMRAIADIWVDTALQLDEQSVRIMERMVRSQSSNIERHERSNRVA